MLYSGHVDSGLGILARVLQQVGIRSPGQNPGLPLDLLLRRARLRLRGLRWRGRAEREVPRSMLIKIDTCTSGATGLALIDVTRGAALQVAGLLLALERSLGACGEVADRFAIRPRPVAGPRWR